MEKAYSADDRRRLIAPFATLAAPLGNKAPGKHVCH
jgi:hypothetical protein